jgi:hypothetical protein
VLNAGPDHQFGIYRNPSVRACSGNLPPQKMLYPDFRIGAYIYEPAHRFAGERIINFLANEDTGKQACFELAPGCFIQFFAKQLSISQNSVSANLRFDGKCPWRKLLILYKLSTYGLCNFLGGKKLSQKLKFWESLS